MRLLTSLILLSLFSCASKEVEYTFLPQDVLNYSMYRWNEDTTALILSGSMKVPLQPLSLSPGKYVIKFKADARATEGKLPVMRLLFGNHFIKDDSILLQKTDYSVKFEIKEPFRESIQFESGPPNHLRSKEKQNIYVHFPVKVVPY